MRRMVFFKSCPLNGSVAAPFSVNQLNAGLGSRAMPGSAAIQIREGSTGSEASAENLMRAWRMSPVSAWESSVETGVLTVSELETYWRAAVAAARRTDGSESEARIFKRTRQVSDARRRSPVRRA